MSVKNGLYQDVILKQTRTMRTATKPVGVRAPPETRNEEDRAMPHYVYRPESTGTTSRGDQPAYDSVPDKCARNSPIGNYATRLVKRP